MHIHQFSFRSIWAVSILFLVVVLAVVPGHAKSGSSAEYNEHARAVANSCLKTWESQACLAAVSYSTLELAANYAERLDARGHKSSVELIKEHCAAGTAASRGEFPAYALKSAWIECANTMYDVAEATGLKPNASHYQLLVGPVLCLEKDRRCANVERGLARFKK